MIPRGLGDYPGRHGFRWQLQTDRVQVIIALTIVDDSLSLTRIHLVFSWPLVSREARLGFTYQPVSALFLEVSDWHAVCGDLAATLGMTTGHSPDLKFHDIRLPS